MGQMLDKTRDQLNNWSWDNPPAFGDQVDSSNPQTTHSGQDTRTCECCFTYGSDDLRVKIVPLSCWQYKPMDFLDVRSLNSDEIIDENDDDGNSVHPGAPSGGTSYLGDGIDNTDGDGEEDT